VRAEPLTGRTHQIRVHAAESGFPVLGDTLYGGTPFKRVCLHAEEITLAHPATNAPLRLSAAADFEADSRLALRRAVLEPEATNAFRLVHGGSDGWPGWYVDKLGGYLLSQSEAPLEEPRRVELARLAGALGIRGVYHKTLSRQVRSSAKPEISPRLVLGEAAPGPVGIIENGVRYELSFTDGYSYGLFLDQRDNRRRLMAGHVGADFPLPEARAGKREVLNAFAYTCGFSVCAALAGGRATSLDLSKKYLEWGRRNFTLNGLEDSAADFIHGDAFDWLRRLAKKERVYDAVVLDPPTFSKSNEYGVFRVEKDFHELVVAALRLLRSGGVLLAATNAKGWPPEKFVDCVESAISGARRKIMARHYVPQPPDFPVSHAESAYLKTLWCRVE
jgi:23S rRNA (cytosine1962-C5)-methyltransferase